MKAIRALVSGVLASGALTSGALTSVALVSAALVTGALTLAVLAARTAAAQEFADPAPPGSGSAAALLERGLPGGGPGASVEAISTRWFALPDLVTRSVALGGGWRSARFALGVSRTGEGEVGWTSCHAAGGWTGPGVGAALRGCVRRYPAPGGAALAGGEVGAGAWASASPDLRLWASAPQTWTGGEAPPLERRLELGALVELPGLDLWLARAAAPGGARGLRAEHAVGLAARGGPLTAWVEVRDRPPRGAVGVASRMGALRVAAEVESHPVLGETVRLGLGLARGVP